MGVEIQKEAFRKTYRDPEFHEEHKNSPAKNLRRSCPKITKGRSKIPREPEVIELFKKLVGAGPLPPH